MNESVSAGTSQRGLRGDHFAGLVLMAIAAFVAWENRVYPLGSLASPGPGSVPLMLAVILGGLGLLIIVRGGASPLLNSIDWSESRRGFVLLIACGVATFALERIGYRLTMIALLVFILGVIERKKLLPTALVALGFAYGSYFMFATLLKVQLPLGPGGI
jgi:putative tricarboxylic transport membrane protein